MNDLTTFEKYFLLAFTAPVALAVVGTGMFIVGVILSAVNVI